MPLREKITSAFLVGMMVFVLLGLGGCEGSKEESGILPPGPPAKSITSEIEKEAVGESPVCSKFEVVPASIKEGESTVVMWQTEDADSGEMTIGDNSFRLSPIDSGSRELTIDEEGSYTVSAVLHGPGGTGTCHAQVIVAEAEPSREPQPEVESDDVDPVCGLTVEVVNMPDRTTVEIRVSWTTKNVVKGSLTWESGVVASGGGVISGARVLQPNVALPGGIGTFSVPSGSGIIKLNVEGEGGRRGRCEAPLTVRAGGR